MHGKASHEAGFTLIEALVVLAIVGMLASLAFPAVDRARTAILARSARAEQGRILVAARAAALRLDRPFVLQAVSRGTGVAVSPEKAGEPGQPPAPTNLLQSDAITRIEIVPQRIFFYPDGSSSGGTIRLTTADGATTTFLIRADLGSVTETVQPRA